MFHVYIFCVDEFCYFLRMRLDLKGTGGNGWQICIRPQAYSPLATCRHTWCETHDYTARPLGPGETRSHTYIPHTCKTKQVWYHSKKRILYKFIPTQTHSYPQDTITHRFLRQKGTHSVCSDWWLLGLNLYDGSCSISALVRPRGLASPRRSARFNRAWRFHTERHHLEDKVYNETNGNCI